MESLLMNRIAKQEVRQSVIQGHVLNHVPWSKQQHWEAYFRQGL